MRACVRLTVGLLLLTFAVQAQQLPRASSKPSSSASPDLGAINDGTYRNSFFAFTFKLPFGWVDRTDVMREDSSGTGNTNAGKGTVLLAVFERPPEATGNTVNAAVVIAAESASSYPGLKDAAQYFGPIDELTKANGFTAINEPYEFPVDGMPVVRQDFSKKLSGATMHQSSLVLLRKGYVVSFTFIAGSEDDITQNLDCLRFGAQKAAKPR